MSPCSAGFGVGRWPRSTGLSHCLCWSLERSTTACEKIATSHRVVIVMILYDRFSTCIIWARPLYLLRDVRIRESSPCTKTVVYNQQENGKVCEGVFPRCWSKWRYVHGEAERVSKVFVTRSRALHWSRGVCLVFEPSGRGGWPCDGKHSSRVGGGVQPLQQYICSHRSTTE